MATRKNTRPLGGHLRPVPSTDAEQVAALERIGAYQQTAQGRVLREAGDLIAKATSLLSVLRRSLGDENAQEIDAIDVALEYLSRGHALLDEGDGIAARAYQPGAVPVDQEGER